MCLILLAASCRQQRGTEEAASLLPASEQSLSPAEPALAPPPASDILSQLLDQPWMRGASVSFAVRNQQGIITERYDAERLLSPASILKLLPTALTLDSFGIQHSFRTVFGYNGSIENGVLKGSLILSGEGDPSLGWNDTEGLARQLTSQLSKAGITEISGVIAATGIKLGPVHIPDNWAWDDIGNYFAPALSGLVLDGNEFRLAFSTGAPGTKAVLKSRAPQIAGIPITHQITAGPSGSGDQAWAYSSFLSNQIRLKGTIPPYRKSFTVRTAFPNPEQAINSWLCDQIERAGIKIGKSGRAHGVVPEFSDTLLVISSPPLSEIVQQTNLKSLNAHAEILSRHLSSDDPDKVADVIQSMLVHRGIEQEHFRIQDGSGLSRANAANAEGITSLLQFASTQDWFDVYKASLPEAGTSGTMKRTFAAGAGKLWAKTGSMSGVLSWAGYFTGKDGKRNSFCLIINNHDASYGTVRKQVEQVMQRLISEH